MHAPPRLEQVGSAFSERAGVLASQVDRHEEASHLPDFGFFIQEMGGGLLVPPPFFSFFTSILQLTSRLRAIALYRTFS